MSASATAKTAPPAQSPNSIFGPTIVSIAGPLGYPPEEVALVMAAIMGNLSGREAGILDSGGRLKPPGQNMLAVSGTDLHTRRLVMELLAPALSMQHYLRGVALRGNPDCTNLHHYGVGNISQLPQVHITSPARERSLQMLQAQNEWVSGAQTIPEDWLRLPGARDERLLNGRLPGPTHCPSMVFMTSDASLLKELVVDTMDQHALLVDPSPGFFRGSFLKSVKIGEAAIANLVSHLGGVDVAIPRLHPLQGHGRFHNSRVRILASLFPLQLAEMMRDREGQYGSLLSHCILWRPTWSMPKSRAREVQTAAWEVYKTALLRILNERIDRTGPRVQLPDAPRDGMARLEEQVLAFMDGQPESIRGSLGAFSGIIPHLVWAFTLLYGKGEEPWVFRAAQATAFYALQQHIALLKESESLLPEKATTKCRKAAKRS